MSSRHGGVSRRSFLTGVSSALALGVPWELLRAEVVPTLSLLPFLARPTTSSILVTAQNGHMDARASLQIRNRGERGPDSWMDIQQARSVTAGEFLNWNLQGLAAGSGYEYQVLMATQGGDPAAVATGTFTTQRTTDLSEQVAARIADESFAWSDDAVCADDVEGGAAFPITPDEIRHGVAVFESIVRSAESGKKEQVG